MVTQQAVIMKLPPPISANRYWAHRVIKQKGTGRWMALTYVTPEAVEYKQQVKKIAEMYGVREPITGRVRLSIDLYPHLPLDWKKRQRLDAECWDDTVQCQDLGNSEKVVSDALNGIVITDDSMFREILLRRMVPDGEARMIVTVTPIPRATSPQPSFIPDVPMGGT